MIQIKKETLESLYLALSRSIDLINLARYSDLEKDEINEATHSISEALYLLSLDDMEQSGEMKDE